MSAGRSKADEAFEKLREEILDGRLLPGARLTEQEVADRLGLSRTPVREAFAKLSALGVVRQERGQRLTVATPTTTEVLNAYALREVLEGLAAAQAAQRCTPDTALVLREVLARLRKATAAAQVDEAVKLTYALHREIYALSGNQLLMNLMEDLFITTWDRLTPSTYQSKSRRRHALGEHERVVEAIAANDAETAERIAREHIAKARVERIKMSAGLDS